MEHQIKQKNQYLRKSVKKNNTPTLKIKNITFTRQYTKNIDKDFLQLTLKVGRDVNAKQQQSKNKNKQNIYQFNIHKAVAQNNSSQLRPSLFNDNINLFKDNDHINIIKNNDFLKNNEIIKQNNQILNMILKQNELNIFKPSISEIFSIRSMNLKKNTQRFSNSYLFESINNQYRSSTSNDKRIARNSYNKSTQRKNNHRLSTLKTSSNNRKSQHQYNYAYQHFNHQNINSLINNIIKSKVCSSTQQKDKLIIIKNQKKLLLSTNINGVDKVFEKKLLSYFNYLQKIATTHNINIQFNQQYQKHPIFTIGKGNNAKLVKEILKKRWWLKYQQKKLNQINNNLHNSKPNNISEQTNFIWTQTKLSQYYQSSYNQIRLHNHFKQNNILGNKKQLFYSMTKYYKSINKQPFNYLPLTFHVENIQDEQYNQFKRYYFNQNNTNNHQNNQSLRQNQENMNLKKLNQAIIIKNKQQKCLWIVKPGQNSNRGRGITIHRQIQQIQKLIKQQKETSYQLNQKQHTFIIQKYIQRPFLYQKRKFDIRHYFLLVNINQSIKGYWYKQGYIRTSCFQFNLNQTNNDDNNFYIHLTNDAVQKNCQQYGKYQQGNKIDYNTFKKYIALKHHNRKLDFDTMIYNKMKQITIDAIKATYKNIAGQKQKYHKIKTFQIFGLDFMIDQNFRPWLIQINTNPCLQTSCLVLERIIPKMIDDALQLSLDIVFPPPLNWVQSKKHMVPNHTCSGFQLVFDEAKQNVVIDQTKNNHIKSCHKIQQKQNL